MLRRASILFALVWSAGCSDETVSVTETDASVMDVPSAGTLRVPTGDGGTLPLQGAWRVVGYELVGAADAGVDGGAGDESPFRYTDRDMPARDPLTGATVAARVNGLLEVSNSTLRLAFGVLRDGRFDVVAPGSPYLSTYDGSGVFLADRRDAGPGVSTVLFSGGSGTAPFVFAAAPDGALWVSVDGAGARRLLLQPEIDAAPATSGEFVLRVRALASAAARPLAAPRTAVFWELPGRPTPVEDLAAPASMAGAETERTLRLDALRVPGVDGTPAVALGHPCLYDDVDGNGRYDVATDAIRSVGQVALGWRAPNGDAGADAVAARLRPGWQVVALHARPSTGELLPLRMDRATAVPLETVATDAPAGALPDVLP